MDLDDAIMAGIVIVVVLFALGLLGLVIYDVIHPTPATLEWEPVNSPTESLQCWIANAGTDRQVVVCKED